MASLEGIISHRTFWVGAVLATLKPLPSLSTHGNFGVTSQPHHSASGPSLFLSWLKGQGGLWIGGCVANRTDERKSIRWLGAYEHQGP